MAVTYLKDEQNLPQGLKFDIGSADIDQILRGFCARARSRSPSCNIPKIHKIIAN